ncbi:MAG: hypothetical protein R3F27_09885 [Gammaproteobacteria bacterium]
MTEEQEQQEHSPRPWSTRAQLLAAVLWPSLLAASFATMLFFAFIDPELLHDSPAADVETSRMTTYGITFFFFWLITALSSAVSVYLVRTSPGSAPGRND